MIQLTLAALAIGATLTAPLPAQRVPRTGATVEQQLAVVNAKRLVWTDDVTIARFRFILAALHEVSGEPPQRIADMLVAAHDQLTKTYGRSTTLLEFAERAYRNRAAVRHVRKFSLFLASLVVSVGAQ